MKDENKNKIDHHIFSIDPSQCLHSAHFKHFVELYGVDQNMDAVFSISVDI